MNLRRYTPRSTLTLLIGVGLLFTSCRFFTPSAEPFTTQPASGALPTSTTPPAFATPNPVGTPTAPATTQQSEIIIDPAQAGLPADFPIYPGAKEYSYYLGLFVDYSVDADVRTTSDFYDNKMKAAGWTALSTEGLDQGSCGGDCGPTPTRTPGPTPTATPVGWMRSNTQLWMKDNLKILIEYYVTSGGDTDISISFPPY
jgi:hypothetical protein